MSYVAAIALTQIVVGLFWLITRWRRLAPWNPEKRIGLRLLAGEMFFNGIPHFVFAYIFMRAMYPLMLLALVYYPLWLFFLWRANAEKRPAWLASMWYKNGHLAGLVKYGVLSRLKWVVREPAHFSKL